MIKTSINIGGKDISLESGVLAKQANGAVTVRCGDTIVLVTAVSSKGPKEGIDFFPLSVEVDEKMYAAGKIPGGFYKREGRPSEKSILSARLIDRPLRPNFPKGFKNEIQIVATILSADQINPPDILGIIGASTALTISDVPFGEPISAVRVGRKNNEWIINPTLQELEESELDIIVAGKKDSLMMVESGAKGVSEEVILEAFELAQKEINKLCELQEQLRRESGLEKFEFAPPEENTELIDDIAKKATEELSKHIRIADKNEREEAISSLREKIVEELEGSAAEDEQVSQKEIKGILKNLEKELVRKMVLDEQVRIDGRGPSDIRQITCDTSILPRTHGTGLFTRGQTQVISILTLGAMGEEQMIDGLGIEESKRFMHHYNFPPFCTGEVGRMTGPRRREIGHGALVERAMLPIIPIEEKFPYTIRIVSEVLESNGSSSMASVCGSTLALMDAGVPISAPVAGIAMGLIKGEDKSVVLTDILGAEDHLGDMDFKVAGTREGVTALQMDIKTGGLSIELLKEALGKARDARLFILDLIDKAISQPRAELSQFAPRVITIRIPQEKIGMVIGPGGKVIRSIIEQTGASIDIEDDGLIFITSKDAMGGEQAKETIEKITKDVVVGEKYLGKVMKIMAFGAFVEVLPGKEGLVHISKLAKERVERVEDVVDVGDQILVEVTEIDKQNRINLRAIEIRPQVVS